MAEADAPADYVLASGVGEPSASSWRPVFAAAACGPTVCRGRSRARAPAQAHPLIGDSSRARERLGMDRGDAVRDIVADLVATDLSEVRGVPVVTVRRP